MGEKMKKIGKFVKVEEKDRNLRLIRTLTALSFRAYLRAFSIEGKDEFKDGWYWIEKEALKAARDVAVDHICTLNPIPRNIITEGVEKTYRLISGDVDINSFWKFYVCQAWIRNIYGGAIEKIMAEYRIEDALLHVKPDLTPLMLSNDALPRDMILTRMFPEEITKTAKMQTGRAKKAIEIVTNNINSFSIALTAIYALYIYSWGIFFSESEDIITFPIIDYRLSSYALKDPEELWTLLEKPVFKSHRLVWSSQGK